jgi:hypothetical protein
MHMAARQINRCSVQNGRDCGGEAAVDFATEGLATEDVNEKSGRYLALVAATPSWHLAWVRFLGTVDKRPCSPSDVAIVPSPVAHGFADARGLGQAVGRAVISDPVPTTLLIIPP